MISDNRTYIEQQEEQLDQEEDQGRAVELRGYDWRLSDEEVLRVYRATSDTVAGNPRRGTLILWTVLFAALAIAGFIGAGLAPRLITSVILFGLGLIACCGAVMVLAVAGEDCENEAP